MRAVALYDMDNASKSRGKTKAMDLGQLERAFDVFGAMDPGTLPFHHAQVFLFIAQQESCTYREIEQRFAITNASASRVVNALSVFARHKKTSLGLVEVFIDPAEGRRYRVRLTKKGKASSNRSSTFQAMATVTKSSISRRKSGWVVNVVYDVRHTPPVVLQIAGPCP